MYKATSTVSSDIINGIDGVDIYNSYALYSLDKIEYSKVDVTPMSGERLDLISKSVYSSESAKKYVGILGILNRFTDNSEINNVKYIPQSDITKLIG